MTKKCLHEITAQAPRSHMQPNICRVGNMFLLVTPACLQHLTALCARLLCDPDSFIWLAEAGGE